MKKYRITLFHLDGKLQGLQLIGRAEYSQRLLTSDVDVFVLLNSDLWKQQSRGVMKNNMWGMKLKVFLFELAIFGI